MGVGFILSAGCASVNIFFDELGHSWPPVSGGDELFSFEISRVPCSLVIMEFFEIKPTKAPPFLSHY